MKEEVLISMSNSKFSDFIIYSIILFILGMLIGSVTIGPSINDCKNMQQRLEQRIVDDKKSLELLKKTER